MKTAAIFIPSLFLIAALHPGAYSFDPSEGYQAGPLYHSTLRPVRQATPSNAPRLTCQSKTCRTSVSSKHLILRAILSKRKQIISAVKTIVNGDGKGTNLQVLIGEEGGLRMELGKWQNTAAKLGCEDCGRVLKDGVGVIRPDVLLGRECARFGRKGAVTTAKLRVLRRKIQRKKRKNAWQEKKEFEMVVEELRERRKGYRMKMRKLGC